MANSNPNLLNSFFSTDEYSWMQAIRMTNAGMSKMPDTSDGILRAIDAVIPEKMSIIVVAAAVLKLMMDILATAFTPDVPRLSLRIATPWLRYDRIEYSRLFLS